MMLMHVFELQIKTKFEGFSALPVEPVSGQMGAGDYVGVELYIYDVDT